MHVDTSSFCIYVDIKALDLETAHHIHGIHCRLLTASGRFQGDGKSLGILNILHLHQQPLLTDIHVKNAKVDRLTVKQGPELVLLA